MSAESDYRMFPDKVMDKLARILDTIVASTEGTPAERAEYIRWNMEQRGSEGSLNEFTSWYAPEEPFISDLGQQPD